MLRSLLLVPAVLVALASPAAAGGPAGGEVTPDPAVSGDGRTVTAFHVSSAGEAPAVQRYRLRNLTDKPVTIRLYAASAEKSASGAYAVSGPGSAPWIELADAQVTLPARGERTGSFVVSSGRAPAATGTVYGAVVLERASASVVTRAATLVYLEGGTTGGGGSRLPLYAGAGAAAAVLLGSAAVLAVRRRRPDDGPLRFGA